VLVQDLEGNGNESACEGITEDKAVLRMPKEGQHQCWPRSGALAQCLAHQPEYALNNAVAMDGVAGLDVEAALGFASGEDADHRLIVSWTGKADVILLVGPPVDEVERLASEARPQLRGR
jgi:hypothetical protein